MVKTVCKSHHWLIEKEPEDPDVMMLDGTCKLCGSKRQWPRKVELNAQAAVFRGYRRNPKIDHSDD